MMNKTNEVVMKIREMGVSATVNELEKNGITKYGISLGGGVVKPTVYVNEDDNRDARTIAEEIVHQYNNLNPDVANSFINIGEEIKDFASVKDKIVPCIMKAEVENLLMKKFLDMNIFYRIILGSDEETASIKITKEIFNMWNIAEEELYNTAISNTKGTYGAKDMFSVLMGICPQLIVDYKDLDDMPMFVVTNESQVYGAAAMLHDELFKAIANDLNKDLYIIPSSIHEVIVVPESDKISPDYVTEMIHEVNENEVSPEEVLSDHVYMFRRSDGRVSL